MKGGVDRHSESNGFYIDTHTIEHKNKRNALCYVINEVKDTMLSTTPSASIGKANVGTIWRG